jgi:hypothetical protein
MRWEINGPKNKPFVIHPVITKKEAFAISLRQLLLVEIKRRRNRKSVIGDVEHILLTIKD